MKKVIILLSVVSISIAISSSYVSATYIVPLNDLLGEYETGVGRTQSIVLNEPINVGSFTFEYSGTIIFPQYKDMEDNIVDGPATNIINVTRGGSVTGTGLFLNLESYYIDGSSKKDYVLEDNSFSYRWVFNLGYPLISDRADIVFNFFYNLPFMSEFNLEPYLPGIINVSAAHITFGASPVPIPGAVWFLGSSLIGMIGIIRNFKR